MNPSGDHRSRQSALKSIVTLGSVALLLQGAGVFYFGTLPSDASRQFLAFGTHLMLAGLSGVMLIWAVRLGGPQRLLRWISVAINGTLLTWVAVLLLKQLVRGPLIVAVPVGIGLPAAFNFAWAMYRVGSNNPDSYASTTEPLKSTDP